MIRVDRRGEGGRSKEYRSPEILLAREGVGTVSDRLGYASRMKIWDRQPGKTDKEFAAWSLYRDLPAPRAVDLSVTAEGAQISTRRPMWDGWAQRFAWELRAAEWDAEIDRGILDQTVDTRTAGLRGWGERWPEKQCRSNSRSVTMLASERPESRASEISPSGLPSSGERPKFVDRDASVGAHRAEFRRAAFFRLPCKELREAGMPELGHAH